MKNKQVAYCPKCIKKAYVDDIKKEEPPHLNTVWYHCERCGNWSPAETWDVFDESAWDRFCSGIAFSVVRKMDEHIPFKSLEEIEEEERKEAQKCGRKKRKKNPSLMFQEWGL